MKETLIKFVLIMILLFLLYKFYPWNRIVEALEEEPLHFLINDILLNKGTKYNIPPTITNGAIIELTKNKSTVSIQIGNYKTTTLYRIVDYKGQSSFKYNNYPIWISEIDKKSNKTITKESTVLELICFQNSINEKKSIMTSIGTITVSRPLIFKHTDTKTVNKKSSIKIPPIFYLIQSKDKKKYIMYDVSGNKYNNVDIDYSTSINNTTTSITINKDTTLYVTSKFNLAISKPSNTPTINSKTQNIMKISKDNKKPTGKKPTGKKPTGKKPTGKKPTGKKPKGKKPKGKKPKGKKPKGKKPKGKRRTRSSKRRTRSSKRRTRSSKRRTMSSKRRTMSSKRRTMSSKTTPKPTTPIPTTTRPIPTTTRPIPTTTTPIPTTPAPTKLTYSSAGSMFGTWGEYT